MFLTLACFVKKKVAFPCFIRERINKAKFNLDCKYSVSHFSEFRKKIIAFRCFIRERINNAKFDIVLLFVTKK